MFRQTLLRRARAHSPLIRFPDRKAPQQSHEPHPHPAAPKEIASDFKHFQEVFSSGPHFHPEKVQSASDLAASSSGSSSAAASSSGSAAKDAVEDLHDLPARFWRTSSMVIDEAEMEAINSGGASLR